MIKMLGYVGFIYSSKLFVRGYLL